MSPLRRRMIEDMQIRNLTVNTQRVYVAQVVHFACHFRKSPDLLGPAEIRTYLIHLTRERHLAASSVIVAVSALRFFYTVTLKRPWLRRRLAPNRRPKRPNRTPARDPGPFNAHNPDGGRSGLVQHVLRSPARIPAIGISVQGSLRRAGKRKTLYVIRRRRER